MDSFRPAWWLPGPHAQTLWGALTRSPRGGVTRREAIATPDGDELILDHSEGEDEGRPRLVLLHGLEGSSQSVYIRGVCSLASERGWASTAVNFRSCAREPGRRRKAISNRTARLYHSGETSDFAFVVGMLSSREPGRKLAAFGGSLGGNVLLKWLGENPDQSRVSAAVAVSTPYDLLAGARKLDSRSGSLYTKNFLKTLRPKALSVIRRFPGAARVLDEVRVRRAKTFFDFDDCATAPLHGFTGAEDYYAKSSSISFLSQIRTPTLCISALDDPFLPASTVEAASSRKSASVEFAISQRGGHLGFVEGKAPWGPRYWAERTAISWLAGRLA